MPVARECILWNWFLKVCESLLSNGTKEISEELRKRLVAAHQTGKYYRSICKVFGLQSSPFGHTVSKWRKFKMIALRSGVIEQQRSQGSMTTSQKDHRRTSMYPTALQLLAKGKGNPNSSITFWKMPWWRVRIQTSSAGWGKKIVLNYQRIFKNNPRTLKWIPGQHEMSLKYSQRGTQKSKVQLNDVLGLEPWVQYLYHSFFLIWC